MSIKVTIHEIVNETALRFDFASLLLVTQSYSTEIAVVQRQVSST